MEFTYVDVFEELRYIIEILLAEYVFIFHTAQKRNDFWKRFVPTSLLTVAISIGYLYVSDGIASLNSVPATIILTTGWYIVLVLLTIVHLCFCFEVKMSQALLYGIAGFAIQHIEFAIVNEALALGIWTSITNHAFLYTLICVVSYALILLFYYLILVKSFKNFRHGIHFPENNNSSGIIAFLLFAMLITLTFIGQSFFRRNATSNDFEPNYFAVLVELFPCVIVLILLRILCSENQKENEYQMVNQLLYENGKQYQVKKEMIDMINTKCHDMKHQIEALKLMDDKERNEQLEDLEKNIMIYDAKVETGNEVLNTLLMEKQLYCINQKIRFSFVGDGKLISFMDTVTLYNLLGNLLDNAIEGVNRLSDENKKSIEFIINKRNENIIIQTNNYYEGVIEMENGLPKTRKGDKANHGFGMKSMKKIAKSYGGTLVIDTKDNIFSVNIILPAK